MEAGRFFGFAGKGSVFLMPPSRASLAPTGFVIRRNTVGARLAREEAIRCNTLLLQGMSVAKQPDS
jgi:hypothetical protein